MQLEGWNCSPCWQSWPSLTKMAAEDLLLILRIFWSDFLWFCFLQSIHTSGSLSQILYPRFGLCWMNLHLSLHSSILINSRHAVQAELSCCSCPLMQAFRIQLWDKQLTVSFWKAVITLLLSKLKLNPAASIKWLQSQQLSCIFICRYLLP